jgi:chromosome segregation ATPase
MTSSDSDDATRAIDRVRTTVDDALAGTERTSQEARDRADRALDDLENRIEGAADRQRVDDALGTVRESVDEALAEAEQLSQEAREEATEAIDDLERRIEELRS